MRTKLIAVVFAAGACAMSAQAADLYVGAGLGSANWKVDDVPGVSIDKRDTGFKLLLGTNLSPNLAIEGGYAHLGKVKLSAPGGSGSIKGDGLFFDVVGMMPAGNDFSLFAKVGIFSGKAKVTASGIGGVLNDSDRGTQLKVGLGGQYDFSKTVGIRGEFERYRFKVFGDKGDTDLFSLGVVVKF